MDGIRFEWDDRKAASNIKKHGVSFEEAKTVFYDNYALLIHDPDHSDNEDRFILLGLRSKMKILVVVHLYKEKDDLIKIISARKATRKESKYYEGKR